MSRRILFLTAVSSVLGAFAAAGCLSEGGVAPSSATADGSISNPIGDGGFSTPDASVNIPDGAPEDDPTTNTAIEDSKQPFLTYRDSLADHPGCTTAGLDADRQDGVTQTLPTYTSATLPGYPCAAREYNQPANEDVTKPIILLVHGNSSSPFEWENVPALDNNTAVKQVAPTLADDGYHVYEADFRVDKVPTDPNNTGKNIDHGWATPILESLIKALHVKYPDRKLNLSGFSLGPTVIRDALRRMHHRGEKPFSYVHVIHSVSAANHGVSTFPFYCINVNNPARQNMVGWAACQLGNRTGYTPVPFLGTLNGPSGDYETPCADGSHAYGQTNVCGANAVIYSTSVHKDDPGSTKDEFVSELSSALKGAEQKTVTELKEPGWFGSLFPNHYGALRTAEGVGLIKSALER